jgi:hypothetical protein
MTSQKQTMDQEQMADLTAFHAPGWPKDKAQKKRAAE